MAELEYANAPPSCLYRYCFTFFVAKSMVTIRVRSDLLTAEVGLSIVDCIIPTKVLPSGVIVSPSMPRFGRRFANSAGNKYPPVRRLSCSKALIRSSSTPSAL